MTVDEIRAKLKPCKLCGQRGNLHVLNREYRDRVLFTLVRHQCKQAHGTRTIEVRSDKASKAIALWNDDQC